MDEPRTAEEIAYHEELCERLKRAYMAALAAQHIGWRVEFHLGSDVVSYLKGLMPKEPVNFAPIATMWGFPIVETTAAPDAIDVHAVTAIA